MRDFFVPLLDDWFIRPLYFVESLDDANIQTLAQAIYTYFGQYFSNPESAEIDLIRITKSELAFLTMNLIKNQVENLSSATLGVMEQVVDQLYFTKEGHTLTIDTLSMPTNGYLL